MKNNKAMIELAQQALDDLITKKTSARESLAAVGLIKAQNDLSRTKLQYNIHQSSHDKIDFLEGN